MNVRLLEPEMIMPEIGTRIEQTREVVRFHVIAVFATDDVVNLAAQKGVGLRNLPVLASIVGPLGYQAA